MINGGSFNSVAFNGESAESGPIIGEGELIAIEQTTYAVESGLLISIEQKVGIISGGAELVMSFEQETILRLVESGELIRIEQATETVADGLLISIEQKTRNNSVPDHLTRTGWDATILLDGNPLPREQIHGLVNIQRNEGGASLMDFTIIPPLGLQDAESLTGKSVTMDVDTPDGTFRIYTGIVDICDIDLIEKKITIKCTDRRTELINTTLASVVPTIGIYSPIIFGREAKDPADELALRLTTVPVSVDFDAYGNYTLANLAPKTSPDFTLTGDDIYYRDPKVEFTSRGRVTNKVTIGFQYRRSRLWHYQRGYSWVSPIASNWCLFMNDGYTLAQRTMIESAVSGLNWPIRGDITWTQIPASGWYCGAAWSTVRFTGNTAYQKDSGGNYVLDSDGNKIVDSANSRITGGTDTRNVWANGAAWQSTTRWVQTITENYTMVVQAPQSQTQFGDVEAANSYSGSDDTDYQYWESDYKAYNNPYNKEDNTYYVDISANRNDVNAAIGTALQIAKTTILSSHRDTRVTIYRSLWPQIDLKHTVQLASSALNAKGKTYIINHILDIGTGEAVTKVTLALSRAQGSQSSSTLSIPAIPTNTTLPDSTTIVLGNHYGENPDNHPEWNGRIGNKFVTIPPFITSRSTYNEQFILDTPTIEDVYRQERNVFGGGTYNVAIPNDLLEVYF